MICVYALYLSNYDELADITIPAMQAYAEQHGYYLEHRRSEQNDLVCGYHKMKVLWHLLHKYETIFVLDVDALITNSNYHVESFINNYDDVFFCEDVHGLNAGSFIIRSTPRSKDFILKIIEAFDAPEEQTMMKQFLNMVAVKYVPHPAFNSYMYKEYLKEWTDKVGFGFPMPKHNEGNWQPGDFVLHLPGLSNERRIEIFKTLV